MSAIWIILAFVIVIILIATANRETPVEKIPDQVLDLHLKTLNDWIRRYHNLPHPSSGMKIKYEEKQKRAFLIVKEIEKRNSSKVIAETVEETIESSFDSLQDYIDKAMLFTGLSNEVVNKFAKAKLEEYEKDFLSQGQSQNDAAANAFSRLISECPMPETDNTSRAPKQTHYKRNQSKIFRDAGDIVSEFNISRDDFVSLYSGYRFSLSFSGEGSSWNDDIDDYARSMDALSEEEIALAKTNFERAILNRIIVRQVSTFSIINQ